VVLGLDDRRAALNDRAAVGQSAASGQPSTAKASGRIHRDLKGTTIFAPGSYQRVELQQAESPGGFKTDISPAPEYKLEGTPVMVTVLYHRPARGRRSSRSMAAPAS